MAEAALWADDALMAGLCSVREAPSSIALGIYPWAKRAAKEHQNLLIRFLFSCPSALISAIRETPPGDTRYVALSGVKCTQRVDDCGMATGR